MRELSEFLSRRRPSRVSNIISSFSQLVTVDAEYFPAVWDAHISSWPCWEVRCLGTEGQWGTRMQRSSPRSGPWIRASTYVVFPETWGNGHAHPCSQCTCLAVPAWEWAHEPPRELLFGGWYTGIGVDTALDPLSHENVSPWDNHLFFVCLRFSAGFKIEVSPWLSPPPLFLINIFSVWWSVQGRSFSTLDYIFIETANSSLCKS